MNDCSVVVPMYNEADHARDVLLAIMAATERGDNNEVVVCDDASADGTGAILADMADRHDDLRVLTNTRNIGIANTLARLTAAASGEYLLRVDGDTRVLPGGLETLYEELHDCADLVCGHMRVWHPETLHQRIMAAERHPVESPSWGGGCIGIRLKRLRDSGGWTLRDGGHRNDETTELRHRAATHGWDTRYLHTAVAETKLPTDWMGIARRKYNYQWLRNVISDDGINWHSLRSPVFWTSMAGSIIASVVVPHGWVLIVTLVLVWLVHELPRAMLTAIRTGKLRDVPLYLGYQCASGVLRTVGAYVGLLKRVLTSDINTSHEIR